MAAVEVKDRPGGPRRILKLLSEHGVNMECMYAFVQRKSERAMLVFRFDKADKAIETLTANGIRLISGEQLYA